MKRKKEIIEEKIYMDEESYKRYLEDIENLEEEIRKANLQRSTSYKRTTTSEWDNSEFLELERSVSLLYAEVRRRREMLKRIVIVKRINNEQLADFGDILELKISDADGIDTLVVKLVGDAKYDAKSGYLEISSNSLIGSLIYGEEIGKKISYKDKNNQDCYVEILQKLNMMNEEKNVKKLVKQQKKN